MSRWTRVSTSRTRSRTSLSLWAEILKASRRLDGHACSGFDGQRGLAASCAIRIAQALAFVAAIALLVAAPTMGGSRAPSVTRAGMATYLAKMRPLNIRYVVFEDEVNSGIESALNGDPAGVDDIRFAAAGIDGLASRMAKVRRPIELSGPHASFVRALRLQVSLARSVENFIASDDLQAARNQFDRLGPDITALERHWRDVVINRLRRAGMTVPLWVKKVGR
jgi:hypothetical protein